MHVSSDFKVYLTICLIKLASCMNAGHSLEDDIAQLLSSKGYIPDDKHLPKASMVKNGGLYENDSTYILTKLSDEALIKLLNEYPKRTEYKMNDIIKASKDIQNNQGIDLQQDINVQNESPQAIFRLNNKEVDPHAKSDADPNYNAFQKINNMLYSRPQIDISAEKKEMLFDVLVAQLKALCCEKSKLKKASSTHFKKNPTEYIFLVVNDEIKSNTSEDLISVDPESLSKNSSVLLLGPLTAPLSDMQTKLVISRLTSELSRPEYLPLLNKISHGSLGKKNSHLLKSFISGPDTRRFIKPHRCNHKSTLSRVYNGPKWLICTGYLNLNTPSLYD